MRTDIKTRTWRHIPSTLFALLLCQTLVGAQLGPQPTCQQEVSTPYPRLDDLVVVKSWSTFEIGRDWKPPACTGWTSAGFTRLITTAARFRHVAESDELLHHVGAISELKGMRYWSTSHNQWQTLVLDAYALTGLPPSQRRKDFTPDEMKEGRVLYFEQVDNLSGSAVYRMH